MPARTPLHLRPWHRGSVFGDGPRRPLCREQRARVKFLLRAHRGVGRITAAGEDVGLALLKRLSADGRCDPSYATLGTDAGCSERTTRRATRRMAEIGLLRWQQRLVRAGNRAVQTSNAYLLLTPVGAVSPGFVSGGQTVLETKPLINQRLTYLQTPASDITAAFAGREGLLERTIREIEARSAGLLGKAR
jgi:hypothetical protein